jgi:hypothetical protein
MTTVSVKNTVIMDTPLEAIDRVLEELQLHPGDNEVMIPSDEMLSHLGTLCEGYRCKYDGLPAAFAMMADTAHRRGSSFHFQRSRAMDLLWKERMNLIAAI